MKQSLIGGTGSALHVVDTEYNCIVSGRAWSTNVMHGAQGISAPGTIRNLRVELTGVPGTGTYTFTFYHYTSGAWGDSTLTCTVAADGTTASDTAHDVTVAPGEMMALKCNPDAPDNARFARWTVEFEGDVANESLLPINTWAIKEDTTYTHAQGQGIQITAENDARQVCPTSGTIKDMYVIFTGDIGTDPDGYRFTLRVNGANSDDGFGNPLQVTVTAEAPTGNDTTHDIDVSAGDVLTVMIEPLNVPQNSLFVAVGMVFVADIDGESLVLGGTFQDLDDTTREFIEKTAAATTFWSGSDASNKQLSQGCILKKLYFLLSGSPGAGNNYTFTTRVNGGNPINGLEVEIADAATTGNDTTHVVFVGHGDSVGMRVTPDSTPTVRDAYWGLVCYITDHTKALSDTVTLSDSIVKAVGQPQADSVAIADAISKEPQLVQAEAAIAIADAISKEPQLGQSDSVAIADAVTKAIGQTQSDTIAIADTFSRVVDYIRAESDSIAIADVIAKAVRQPQSDSIAIADSISKAIGLVKADIQLIYDSRAMGFYLNVTDVIAIADTFDRVATYTRSLSDTVAIVDSIIKGVGLQKLDSMGMTDSISKGLEWTFTDVVDITDALAAVQVGPNCRITSARLSSCRLTSSRLGVARFGGRRL